MKEIGIVLSISPREAFMASSPPFGIVITTLLNSERGRKASRAILTTLLPLIREYSFFSPFSPLLNLSLFPAAVKISAKSLDIL